MNKNIVIEKHRRQVATIKMSFGLVYIFSGYFMCIFIFIYAVLLLLSCVKPFSSDDRVAGRLEHFFYANEHNCKCEYCPLKFSRIFFDTFFLKFIFWRLFWRQMMIELSELVLCHLGVMRHIYSKAIKLCKWVECILTLYPHLPNPLSSLQLLQS